MTTHGKQPNVGKERTGTSPKERTGTSPTVPRRIVSSAAAAQPKTRVVSSSTVSRNLKPTEKSPALSRGRSFDNKSSTPSNATLQKSHSTIARTTRTSPVPKPLLKSSQKSDAEGRSSANHRPRIGTSLNKKAATNSSIVSNRKVKPLDVAKAPVVAEEKNHDIEEIEKNHDNEEINEEEVVVEENKEGLIAIVDSDRDDDEQQQQGIIDEDEEHEEEEVIDDETSTTNVQIGEKKEEQINIEEESDSKIEASTDHHNDLPMDENQEQINNIQEQGESNIETSNHLLPIGEEEQINIEKQSKNETETETNAVPPMVEEEEIKIDDPDHEDQEKEIEKEINPEKTGQEEENQKQEAEQVKEESPQEGGGEKFLKASEIRKLMEAQTSGKDLTSSATSSPRLLVRGSSGINRGGSFNKKESPAASASNEVIEETASKLIAEKRRNKVLALAGAFETVISLQQD